MFCGLGCVREGVAGRAGHGITLHWRWSGLTADVGSFCSLGPRFVLDGVVDHSNSLRGSCTVCAPLVAWAVQVQIRSLMQSGGAGVLNNVCFLADSFELAARMLARSG